jgi:hypothetical protein
LTLLLENGADANSDKSLMRYAWAKGKEFVSLAKMVLELDKTFNAMGNREKFLLSLKDNEKYSKFYPTLLKRYKIKQLSKEKLPLAPRAKKKYEDVHFTY